MTLTTCTGGAAAGGGGGGGGGGGAVRKACNVAVGSPSKKIIGRTMSTEMKAICPKKAVNTVHVFLVFPESTNVCSNIEASFPCPPRRPSFGEAPRPVLT